MYSGREDVSRTAQEHSGGRHELQLNQSISIGCQVKAFRRSSHDLLPPLLARWSVIL